MLFSGGVLILGGEVMVLVVVLRLYEDDACPKYGDEHFSSKFLRGAIVWCHREF